MRKDYKKLLKDEKSSVFMLMKFGSSVGGSSYEYDGMGLVGR